MKIDLTDLMESLDAGPIVLTIGGVDFTLNDLTVARVEKLNAFAQLSDRDGLDFLASLFGANVPPVVRAFGVALDACQASPAK